MFIHTCLHFKQSLLLVNDPTVPCGIESLHGEWLVLMCCDATNVRLELFTAAGAQVSATHEPLADGRVMSRHLGLP